MTTDENGNSIKITLHAAIHTCRLLNREAITPDVSQIPDLARLLKLTEGGQILLSEACHGAYLREHGNIPFKCLRAGGVHLKGVASAQYYYLIEGYGEPATGLIGFENVVASDSYIVRKATEKKVRDTFKQPYGRASETRFVTIYGEGGMGKTRLGVTCARQMAAFFTGGVVFVPFAFFDERDPAKVAEAVAYAICRALKLPDTASKAEEVLISHLRGSPPLLLLLDNAETIATQRLAVEYLQRLLDSTRDQQHCFLATSRKWLNLWAEGRIDVNEGLTNMEALALFRTRARQQFSLPQTSSDDVSRLGALLAKEDYRLPPLRKPGIPEEMAFPQDEYDLLRLLRLFHLANHNTLAIELIASWTGLYLTPNELLVDYEKSAFSSFTETDMTPFGDEKARERHRSLQASYFWSWKNLSAEANGADAQTVFLTASLFVDTFSAEGLQAILGWDDKLRFDRARKTVVDAALCRAEQSNNLTRYRMHWQLP